MYFEFILRNSVIILIIITIISTIASLSINTFNINPNKILNYFVSFFFIVIKC
jgi:hypothetical protein